MLGKTVVNLNYTANVAALLGAIDKAEIKSIYTSTRFVKKLKDRGVDIDSLFENLPDLVDFDLNKDRYSAELHDFLSSKNVYNLTPSELIQFLYDISVDLDGSEIHIQTEEDDVSGIQKLMLHKGAKIEMFSAHDYPESDKEG